jgi:hypothetical protein
LVSGYVHSWSQTNLRYTQMCTIEDMTVESMQAAPLVYCRFHPYLQLLGDGDWICCAKKKSLWFLRTYM